MELGARTQIAGTMAQAKQVFKIAHFDILSTNPPATAVISVIVPVYNTARLETHPEVDMTLGHSLVVNEEDLSMGFKTSSIAGIVSFSQLLRVNEIGNGSCVVARREALVQAGPFAPTLVACVDIDVWLRIARLRPNNVVAIPEVLTFYRRRQGQVTGDWRRMESAYLQLMGLSITCRLLLPRACYPPLARFARWLFGTPPS